MRRSRLRDIFKYRVNLGSPADWSGPVIGIIGAGAITAFSFGVATLMENATENSREQAAVELEQTQIQTYGSTDCAAVRSDLAEALNRAISGGNQSIIDSVVDNIEAYQEGIGERAQGDQCTFPQISEDLAIYNLD